MAYTWSFPSNDPNSFEPYIRGKSEWRVQAHVDFPPPRLTTPGHTIPVLIIVRVEPRPDPSLWETTKVEMTVTQIWDPQGGPKYVETVSVKGGLEVDEEPDVLFFVFENFTFPKAGQYKLKFDVSVESYLFWREGMVPGNPCPKSYRAGMLEVPLIYVIEGLTVEHDVQGQRLLSKYSGNNVLLTMIVSG